MMGTPHGTIAERLWRHVDKSSGHGPWGDCWVWIGNRNKDGYGRIGAGPGSKDKPAVHRVSWEIHNGPIPEGMRVLHRCDNPPCVRADHLFLGTQLDNIADMKRKGRQSRLYGSENPAAKLHEFQVIAIRSLAERGICRSELARMYGVYYQTIDGILKRKRWSHVP